MAANVIIKSEERRQQEAYVLEQFGKGGGNASREAREAAECINARTQEAYKELCKMEGIR